MTTKMLTREIPVIARLNAQPKTEDELWAVLRGLVTPSRHEAAALFPRMLQGELETNTLNEIEG
jgi:quinol monooxygenase YgiN